MATRGARQNTAEKAFRQIESARRQAYEPAAHAARAAPQQKITVVAEGDSWFSYFPPNDVLACLRSMNWGDVRYDVRDRAKAGALLNDMVYGRDMVDTYQLLQDHSPDVFIFSGGGNDIAGQELFCMLYNKRAIELSPTLPRINSNALKGIVNEILGTAYQHMVNAIRSKATAIGKPDLPILVHGYDYAIPDGRGWGGGAGPLPGPWLDPSLTHKGYDRKTDAKLRRDLIRQLIDAFNDMLANLAKTNKNVYHVDLRDTLKDNEWANELHPDKAGFQKVATEIEAAIRGVTGPKAGKQSKASATRTATKKTARKAAKKTASRRRTTRRRT